MCHGSLEMGGVLNLIAPEQSPSSSKHRGRLLTKSKYPCCPVPFDQHSLSKWTLKHLKLLMMKMKYKCIFVLGKYAYDYDYDYASINS